MSRQNNVFGKRIAGNRSEKKVLIVCEGEKTEPLYFQAFDLKKEKIDVSVIGIGMNTDSLVEYAIGLKTQADQCSKPYSHVWCVFDRDSFSAQQFNRALQIANNNGIKVAYSNEAFEVWYILHFEYFQTGSKRDSYKKKLTSLMKKRSGNPKMEYKKNDPAMYAFLHTMQPDARKFAQKLIDFYGAAHIPEKDNPSTTVHKLVEFLNEYI